jgi:hypothetical protein
MSPTQPKLFWSTLSVIVTALLTSCLAPKGLDYIPHCFRSPILAIELPRSADDITSLLDRQPVSPRHAIRIETYADFLFILSYVCLWFMLSRKVSKVLGSVIIFAGIADFFENIGILRAVGSTAPTQAIADATRYPSLAKWTLLGVVFLSFLYLFLPRDEAKSGWQILYLVVGLSYAYAGILCVTGVLFQNLLIEQSILPLSAALILQLIAYAFIPSGN